MGSDLEPDVRNEASNEIRHQYLSAAKARRRLGWSPRFDLETGLRKTIAWYQGVFLPWLSRSKWISGPLTQPRSPKQVAAPTAGRADALRADPGAGRRVLPRRLSGPAVPAWTSPVPVAGRVFDDREVRAAGGFRPRLLAHGRALRRSVRARVRAALRHAALPCLSTPVPPRTLLAVSCSDLAAGSATAGCSPATRSSPSRPASRPRSTRSSRTAWSPCSST